MKAAGERPGTPGLGPLTSTPRIEPRPAPPPPAHSKRNVSSSSLSSESSEEDWLIKVCCPGARHRYCKNARSTKPAKIEFQKSLGKEDELSGCSSITSDQSYLRVPRKESSELEWLIRLRCPGAQMEQRISEPKQCLPEVPSSNKPGRSNQSSKSKPTESWLTQKHLSAMQAVINGGSLQSLLERENCFVRHGAYLESYNPSVYDPYYLKNTDIWKGLMGIVVHEHPEDHRLTTPALTHSLKFQTTFSHLGCTLGRHGRYGKPAHHLKGRLAISPGLH